MNQAATGNNIAQGGDNSLNTVNIQNKTNYIVQNVEHERLDYPKQVESVLKYHSEIFVGREAERALLANFSVQQKPGYLVVKAAPGYGKSALIADFIQCQAKEQDKLPLSLLFYFVGHQHDHNGIRDFFWAVNSQLLNLLEISDRLPSELDQLRSQFRELWQQATARVLASPWGPAKPLVLLIDGLDEDPAPLAAELPGSLPDYVHIVITSRPNPDPLQQIRDEHQLREARVHELTPFEAHHIQQLLNLSKVSSQVTEDDIEKIRKLTNGHPNYVRLICKSISKQGRVVLTELEDELPRSFQEYIGRQLRHLFRNLKGTTESELARNILAVLSVTLGGITQRELAEILEIEPYRIRDALQPIERFVLGVESLKLVDRWFCKAIRVELGKKSELYNQKLLTWCKSYQEQQWPDTTPDYVLLHYGRHLNALPDKQLLYQLVDKRWMELKWQHPSGHTSLAHDVVAAIDVAVHSSPTKWVPLVRSCLVHATLVSFARNVHSPLLGVLAYADEIEKAQSYADLRLTVSERIWAYKDLTSKFWGEEFNEFRSSRPAEVDRAKFEQIVDRVRCLHSIPSTWRLMQAKQNAERNAYWVRSHQNSPPIRHVGPVRSESALQLEAERFEIELWWAEHGGQEGDVGIAFNRIACRLGQARDKAGIQRMLAVAARIESNHSKEEAVSAIVAGLASAGEIDLAFEAANLVLNGGFSDNPGRLRNITASVMHLGRLDYLKQILESAWSIQAIHDRVSVLSDVAETLAEYGQIRQAKHVVNIALELLKFNHYEPKIGYEIEKQRFQEKVLSILFKMDMLDQAVALARTAWNMNLNCYERGMHQKIEWYYSIARTAAGRERYDLLALIQQYVEDEQTRFASLDTTKVKGYEQDTIEKIKAFFEQAVTEVQNYITGLLEKLEDSSERSSKNNGQYSTQPDRSVQMAGLATMHDEQEHLRLSSIEGHQYGKLNMAEVGDKSGVQRAAAIAQALENNDYRYDAIKLIAPALAEIGEFEQALTLVVQDRENISHVAGEIISGICYHLLHTTTLMDALPKIVRAIKIASQVGREELFTILKASSYWLAQIDSGETLWEIYQAVEEIEVWWSYEKTLKDLETHLLPI